MTSIIIKYFCFVVTIQMVFCKADEDFHRPGIHHFISRVFRGSKNPEREYDFGSCEIDEECVQADLCDDYSGEQSLCGNYHERKVCCPKRELETLEESASAVSNSVVKSGPFPKAPVCGQVMVVENRITAGKNAPAGKFPWMAALWYSQLERYLCGGSIITSRHVMTAAHCIRRDLKHVRLGDVDLQRDDNDAAPVDIAVKKAVRHEEYDNYTRVNDIGLLVLAKEITFNRYIKPICLPPIESFELQSGKSNFIGEEALVAGWGAIKYGGPSLSWLQFAKLKILSIRKCQTAYGNYPLVITESQLCAGDPGPGAIRRDSCTGDSGGPLMYVQPPRQQYYQIGIVAFGYDCGKPEFPGLYTRVDKYLKWLGDKVIQN